MRLHIVKITLGKRKFTEISSTLQASRLDKAFSSTANHRNLGWIGKERKKKKKEEKNGSNENSSAALLYVSMDRPSRGWLLHGRRGDKKKRL